MNEIVYGINVNVLNYFSYGLNTEFTYMQRFILDNLKLYLGFKNVMPLEIRYIVVSGNYILKCDKEFVQYLTTETPNCTNGINTEAFKGIFKVDKTPVTVAVHITDKFVVYRLLELDDTDYINLLTNCWFEDIDTADNIIKEVLKCIHKE